jgi:branched-chain amino acid transport system substrate-binding protein
MRSPTPQPGAALAAAIIRLRQSVPQLAAQVVQRWQPWLPRARDTQTLRLVRPLLVGIVLVGTLFSMGVAEQHPLIGGGKLCLATEFPTAEDGDKGVWGRSLEHAVDLAAQQNQPLGNGYTLEVIHYREVSSDTARSDPRQGARNVTAMVQTPCVVGMVGPAWSAGAAAEMPVTAKAGLVMISPANTNPGLTLRLDAGTYGIDFNQLHPPGTKTNYFRNIANDAF